MATRRQFLLHGGLLFAAAGMAPAFLTRAGRTLAAEGASNSLASDTILVVIQMSGGNDGLNMVVPYGLDGYHAARPNIGIADSDVLPLTDTIGLHPQMGKLRDRYTAGQVAIVQGVGYPNPILSHFQSMDVWQRADPDGARHDGWLGDYLAGTDAAHVNPMFAASISDGLSPSLRAPDTNVAAIASLQAYQFRGDPKYPNDTQALLSCVSSVYGQPSVSNKAEAYIATTATAALKSSADVRTAAQAYASNVDYPGFPLANSLKTVAQIIASNLGTRLFSVSFGGFDTHAAQANTHARLLGGFSDSVEAFLQDMEQQGKGDRVVLMTFSEFGRRVHENGSQGTDHGTAEPMLVIGAPVKGSLYGDHPSLTSLDSNNNLKYGVDFRSVYGTVLESWLGADQRAVLGSRYDNVGFV